MSFSAGWCLQAPLLWPCRSMRQDARAHEAPQHPIALSQQLHTHVVLRARRLRTALGRYVAGGARAWTCATAWPPWNSRAWLCAAQQSAYGALAGRAKNVPHELPIEEVWWILWTDALWLAQQRKGKCVAFHAVKVVHGATLFTGQAKALGGYNAETAQGERATAIHMERHGPLLPGPHSQCGRCCQRCDCESAVR